MTSLYASEIAGLFPNLDRDVTELFPDATYAHFVGLFAVVMRGISGKVSAF
jgi:hypothetical protein